IMVSAQTNSDSSYPYHIVDAITLYQYVFTHYTRVSVVHKDELIKKVILTHSAKDEYPLKAKQDINVLVKDGNVDHIKIVYDGKTHVEAPLFVDDKIATLNVYDGKDVIYKEDIYLQENIEKDSIAYYFHHLDRFVMDFKYVIITCVALIFVSLTYLKYKKQK
ncbi:MAG: hypothetical protein EOM11_04760, partial [Erysipelotrichia bacterium]|nr:hypothetical protein [Erysipelotrichia bacterium]